MGWRPLLLAFVVGYIFCALQSTGVWCGAMRHGNPLGRCLADVGPVILFPWPWALGWIR